MIVSGPPRCGTYWLARFLRHACGVPAEHEWVNFFKTGEPEYSVIDCNNTFLISGRHRAGDVPVVWIRRDDWEEATRRWAESIGVTVDEPTMNAWHEEVALVPAESIEFHDLFTVQGITQTLAKLDVPYPGDEVVHTWLWRKLDKPYNLWMA